MAKQRTIYANADIEAVILEVPEGHRHLRAVLCLKTGAELVLQEATVANLVRAYIRVKTDPVRQACTLRGRELDESERKPGFAAWQLLDED